MHQASLVAHPTQTVFLPSPKSPLHTIQPLPPTMAPGAFTSKSFSATLPNTLAAKYRKALQKHPFLLFGLPFISTIVAGSFMLTPATALRYERYDRKNQQITQEEAMGLRAERRKVNMKDEYYVSRVEFLLLACLRLEREELGGCGEWNV